MLVSFQTMKIVNVKKKKIVDKLFKEYIETVKK